MKRQLYILAKWKMPTLVKGTGDLILEDIIDMASDINTRIVDNENSIKRIKTKYPELKYCYKLEINSR